MRKIANFSEIPDSEDSCHTCKEFEIDLYAPLTGKCKTYGHIFYNGEEWFRICDNHNPKRGDHE